MSLSSLILQDVIQLVLFNLLFTTAIFVLPVAKYSALHSLTVPPSALGKERAQPISRIYVL